MSDIADKALNHLESSIRKAKKWINRLVSWFVYSRRSTGNIDQYERVSDEQKAELQKLYNEDPSK